MFPTASISGPSLGSTYSQSLNIGNFYVIVLLEGVGSGEEMELGHNLLSKIEETINQTPTITPLDLVQMQSGQLQTEVKLSLLVAKIEGQKLWVAGLGKVEAKLVRKGAVVHLFLENQEVKSVNGPVRHGDFLVLGTTAFISSIPPSDLVELSNIELEEVKEKMITSLESKENRAEMAAQIVRVDLIPRPTSPSVDSPNITSGSSRPSFLDRIKPRGQWVPTVLRPENPTSRRTLYMAVVIFIIFLCLVSFQLRSKNLETNAKNLIAIEGQVEEGLNSANKLAGINDQVARETLLQTKKDIAAQIESLYGVDWKSKSLTDKKRLLEILEKIDRQIEKVSHVYPVSKLPTFYDFSLMKSGPKIVSANLHDGKIVALDGANGAIYFVATANKGAELVTGNSDLRSGKYIDSTLDGAYVFLPKGIYSKKFSTDSFKQVAKSSDKFGEIKGLSAFGGNLYLLDPKNNQIWKLQGADNGFSEPVNYIKEGLSVSIGRGISMSIDGFIYVLTSGGPILKFASGDVSEFTISGLPEPISNPTAFFTSDQVENVYVWDEGSKAVFVLNKKGIYQAEYKLSGEAQKVTVKGILADEEVKKIFLLSDSMAYAIDLKN